MTSVSSLLAAVRNASGRFFCARRRAGTERTRTMDARDAARREIDRLDDQLVITAELFQGSDRFVAKQPVDEQARRESRRKIQGNLPARPYDDGYAVRTQCKRQHQGLVSDRMDAVQGRDASGCTGPCQVGV